MEEINLEIININSFWTNLPIFIVNQCSQHLPAPKSIAGPNECVEDEKLDDNIHQIEHFDENVEELKKKL